LAHFGHEGAQEELGHDKALDLLVALHRRHPLLLQPRWNVSALPSRDQQVVAGLYTHHRDLAIAIDVGTEDCVDRRLLQLLLLTAPAPQDKVSTPRRGPPTAGWRV
jgi:hypothetical protein